MQLIEPDEYQNFLSALQRQHLPKSDFTILETDMTDPKSDENFGLQGYVTITRLSTQVTKEYVLGDAGDWARFFKRDLDAGVFGK